MTELREYYYILRNNGDGSASIIWLESKELGEYLENTEQEEYLWGEPSLDFIRCINLQEKLLTKEEVLIEILNDDSRDIDSFLEAMSIDLNTLNIEDHKDKHYIKINGVRTWSWKDYKTIKDEVQSLSKDT